MNRIKKGVWVEPPMFMNHSRCFHFCNRTSNVLFIFWGIEVGGQGVSKNHGVSQKRTKAQTPSPLFWHNELWLGDFRLGSLGHISDWGRESVVKKSSKVNVAIDVIFANWALSWVGMAPQIPNHWVCEFCEFWSDKNCNGFEMDLHQFEHLVLRGHVFVQRNLEDPGSNRNWLFKFWYRSCWVFFNLLYQLQDPWPSWWRKKRIMKRRENHQATHARWTGNIGLTTEIPPNFSCKAAVPRDCEVYQLFIQCLGNVDLIFSKSIYIAGVFHFGSWIHDFTDFVHFDVILAYISGQIGVL